MKMNSNSNKILMIIISASQLVSCASMNSSFDCPKKPGVNCESIDQVNARVDRGEFSGSSVLDCSSTDCQSTSLGKKMKIWIAPYTDTDGNYHEGGYIYSGAKAYKEEAGS